MSILIGSVTKVATISAAKVFPGRLDSLRDRANRTNVVIRLDPVSAAGERIAVEVVLTMRLVSMQIAPQRHSTNRVSVERKVVQAWPSGKLRTESFGSR